MSFQVNVILSMLITLFVKLFSISEAEVAVKKVNQAKKAKNWDACMEESSKALLTATHSVTLRQLRADCALGKGDIDQAVGDLT